MGDGDRRFPVVQGHARRKVMGPAGKRGPSNPGWWPAAICCDGLLAGTHSATLSLRPLEAEKWAYLFAAIVIVWPVAGLRP